MSRPTRNHTRQSLWILTALVLCLVFLIAADRWLLPLGVSLDHSPAQGTETVFSAAITPLPATPTLPSPTPRALMESTMPDDPYPDLYGDNPNQAFAPPIQKCAYLTFDDGPSRVTHALLQMLRQEEAPATFFVVGDSREKRALLRQMHEDGHSVGVHTYTHRYDYVYWNKEAFLADFSRQYYTIWDATGCRPRIFRFPGGSVNSHNRHLYKDLIWEMEHRGFVYYDWNVASGDAVGITDAEKQLDALITQSQNKHQIIALLHDTDANPNVCEVARKYIRYLRENGYTLCTLDSSVPPIQFPR